MAETVESADSSLSWHSTAVDIDHIESELSKLRYLAAGRSDGGTAVRTSLANMVVHADDEETAAHASRVTEELSRHHPSRAQIIIAQPSQDESHIEASLAVHCHMNASMEQNVSCEQITLRVSGKAAYHVHSIIASLLVSDLPVTVWWMGDFPDDTHLVAEMCQIADYFIIDSVRFQDQTRDLVRVRNLADLHRCEVGDLNFERLRPWRDIFDRYVESGGLAGWRAAVSGIEIRYADLWGRQTPGQAVMMLGWLAGRLALDTNSVTGQGSEHLVLRNDDGREIPAHLGPVGYEGVDRGWLVTVKVTFEDERGRAFFAMSRTADPLAVTILTQLPGNEHQDHVRIEATDNPSILTRQLDAAPHDPGFRSLLHNITPLIQVISP